MRGKITAFVGALATLAASASAEFVYEGKWGSHGAGEGEFNYPRGVGVAPNGNVYVSDMGNHRIQYFTPTGSFLGKWGRRGSGDGQFAYPRPVDGAPNGDIYVADSSNHRVQYFTSSGSWPIQYAPRHRRRA